MLSGIPKAWRGNTKQLSFLIVKDILLLVAENFHRSRYLKEAMFSQISASKLLHFPFLFTRIRPCLIWLFRAGPFFYMSEYNEYILIRYRIINSFNPPCQGWHTACLVLCGVMYFRQNDGTEIESAFPVACCEVLQNWDI